MDIILLLSNLSTPSTAPIIHGINSILTTCHRRTTIVYFQNHVSDTSDALLQLHDPLEPFLLFNLDLNPDFNKTFLSLDPLNSAQYTQQQMSISTLLPIPSQMAQKDYTRLLPKQSIVQIMMFKYLNGETLLQIRNLFKMTWIINVRHKVLIVFIQPLERPRQEMETTGKIKYLLKWLWHKYKYLNVAIATCQTLSSKFSMTVHTFNPYINQILADVFMYDERTKKFDSPTGGGMFRFMDKTANFHRSKFVVKMEIDFATVFNVSGKLRYGDTDTAYSVEGRDVNLALLLADLLNAKALLVIPLFFKMSDSLIPKEILKYTHELAKPVPSYQPIIRPLNIEYVVTYKVWSSFNRRMHVDMEPQYFQTPKRTSLYPHELTDILVLVPNRYKHVHKLSTNIATSPIVYVWCYTAIVVMLVRKIIQMLQHRQSHGRTIRRYSFQSLYFDTFSILISTPSAMKLNSRPEKVLRIFLSIAAILMGLIITNLIYKGYYENNDLEPELDSLHELSQSTMNVCVSERNKEFVQNGTLLNRRLRGIRRNNRVLYFSNANLSTLILEKNISCAYFSDKKSANLMISGLMDNETIPTYRKMNERLGQQLLSYSVPKPSPMENRLNVLLRRISEHGFLNFFELNNQRINNVAQHTQKGSKAARERLMVNRISLSDLEIIFYFYYFANAVSIICFLLELLINRNRRANIARRLHQLKRRIFH